MVDIYRIAMVKKHPEYAEERMYVLAGQYGNELTPMDADTLREHGFNLCVDRDELNRMFREGEYLPPNGRLHIPSK